MSPKIILRAVIGMTTLMTASIGQPASAQPMIHGHGALSCGQWSADHRANGLSALTLDGWLNGFLSAVNVYRPGTIDDIAGGIDQAGRIAWMTRYCDEHPLDSIALAAIALIKVLRARAGTR